VAKFAGIDLQYQIGGVILDVSQADYGCDFDYVILRASNPTSGQEVYSAYDANGVKIYRRNMIQTTGGHSHRQALHDIKEAVQALNPGSHVFVDAD